ncbi:MoaD/ThiS family protein [Luteimonas viscosa]|uniref:Molybdopterin synthase sulfur carrier subunit n=1 Tax=Luteimonas viscosa TaxID=1132694 RepID=A0A5D4XX48_9GAMM|nr:MoaD/ThiS family protein [Luteimonas viscosa]TYT27490.1 MoaD/ThiS family protein [Luteimonas viscosa]
MMVRVTLLYFASLRDAAGAASETLESDASDLAALYAETRLRHGFALPSEHLRVAVDGAFAAWTDAVRDGTEIAFIPPVSGG